MLHFVRRPGGFLIAGIKTHARRYATYSPWITHSVSFGSNRTLCDWSSESNRRHYMCPFFDSHFLSRGSHPKFIHYPPVKQGTAELDHETMNNGQQMPIQCDEISGTTI
jgi:hypothetical protein